MSPKSSIKIIAAFGVLLAVFWKRDEIGDIGETALSMAGFGWKKATPFDNDFRMAEFYYNLPENLLKRVAWQESRFNPDAVSPAGARGLMQFMPRTWAAYDFGPDKYKIDGYEISDPKAQISAAGKMLSDLYRQFGRWDYALAAYNWGSGNVSAWLKTGVGAKGQPMPTETRNYMAQIVGDLEGIA